MPEGLYWYHPHVHGEVQAQMLMGLAGAIVVEGPEHDARRAAGIAERVLIVRQTQDQDAGKTPAASMTAAPPTRRRAHARPRADRQRRSTPRTSCCARPTPASTRSASTARRCRSATRPTRRSRASRSPPARAQFWQLLNAATDAFLEPAIVEDEQARAADGGRRARRQPADRTMRAHRLHPAPTTEPQSVPPSGRIEFFVAAPPAGRQGLSGHARGRYRLRGRSAAGAAARGGRGQRQRPTRPPRRRRPQRPRTCDAAQPLRGLVVAQGRSPARHRDGRIPAPRHRRPDRFLHLSSASPARCCSPT